MRRDVSVRLWRLLKVLQSLGKVLQLVCTNFSAAGKEKESLFSQAKR